MVQGTVKKAGGSSSDVKTAVKSAAKSAGSIVPETSAATGVATDWSALGLRCGLEIHQQVGYPDERNPGRKLFCACPARIVEGQPDVTIERNLRASVGELGALDDAAKAEQEKNKKYVYQAYRQETCLVELDEEPPHPVNADVVTTAVMVAKACNSLILPHVQFMRKTIVDGSAVSGFQRTGMFALGGEIPETTPRVRVQTICIEEDAAKIVTRTHDADTYNLSRLGIPLIEIATEADIISPQHAQETAAQLGMLLRSTRRVKRGLGTIRQDVNISIAGGNRVEIKGCQDLRLIPTYVEYEAKRQKNLLRIRDILTAGRLAAGSQHANQHAAMSVESAKLIDVTHIVANTTASFLKTALAKGEKAIGIAAPHMHRILGTELCPNYRVGSELADLARAAGFGGLIHSDEDLKKYGLLEQYAQLRSAFALDECAAFIIVVGERERVTRLLDDRIIPRIVQLGVGVLSEVRKANPDGTTSFLRTMPGASRMYPETDVPVVHVSTGGIAAPKLMTEQVRDIVTATGISEDQARAIVREGVPFDDWLARFPSVEPTFIATAVLTYGKEILSRYKREVDHISALEPLLGAVERKQIPKSAVFEILVELAEGKTTLDALDLGRYTQMPNDELLRIVRDVLANASGTPNALMGQIMAKVRGKADGKRIMQLMEQVQHERQASS